MARINFSIKDKFHTQLQNTSDNFGVSMSDYIRSLILEDLKKQSKGESQ